MARNEQLSKLGVRETWTERLSDGATLNPALSTQQVSEYVLKRPDVIRRTPDAKQWRDPTPWTVEKSMLCHWEGHIARFDPWGGGYYYHDRGPKSGSYSGFSTPNPLPSANAVHRTEINALLKAKNEKVNWAMMFASYIPSVNTLASTALRLLSAYQAVKRRDVKGAASILGVPNPKKKGKDTADDWLALQYGWMPLANDVYSTYEGLRNHFKDFPPRFGVKATSYENLERVIPIDKGDSRFWRIYKTVPKQNFSLVTVRLDFEVESEQIRSASLVGLENPVFVAWDLVPWSFVADWIVPVGDWLQAITATAGLRFLGGTKTLAARTLVTGQFALPPRSVNKVYDPGSYSYEKFHMIRTVYLSSPIPIPYVKNPLSTAHLLNSTALIRSIK